jgi:ABC-type multidrug transport system ATPase subunit
MIELDHVTKRYGRRHGRPAALHDVTLQVPEGGVWAVVGPNGAGKSTLLALVLGFIHATKGRVLLAGAPPRDYLRDIGAGYLPEQFRVPGEWRTRDALRMFDRLGGGDAPGADAVIAQFGLEPHLDKRTGELSRGLLQRVGLAQALLDRRPLVVLDEPTEGLDPVWRIRLRDILASLREAGTTVLMASHDLGEVERVADRAVLLEDGGVRDVIETRATDPPSTFRIRLAAPFGRIAEAFPDAAADAGGTSFTVTVASAAELSERVGALIALGAVIAAVEPLRQPLEERVRDALEGDRT